MITKSDLQKKVNEDFWISRLKEMPFQNFNRANKNRNPDEPIVHRVVLPDHIAVLLEKASLGKLYNKFLFFITALYLWSNRFTRNDAKQTIITPSLNVCEGSTSANLLFLNVNALPGETIRSLLRMLHGEIQGVCSKIEYDFDAVKNRFFNGANADLSALINWGIYYDKINHPSAHLSHANLLFSFYERDGGDIELKITINDPSLTFPPVEFIGGQYFEALSNICSDIDAPVDKLNIVSKDEKLLMDKLNDNDFIYSTLPSFLHQFRHLADLHAGKPAMVFENRVFTYEQLNILSDHVAAHLSIVNQVKPNDIVGLIIGHNEWRIISILGILKTGAAYLPIKADFPLNRIRFMLQDCNCKVLVTDTPFESLLEEINMEAKVFLSTDIKNSYSDFDPRKISIGEKNPFVVLYTSGSSGSPKGVLINHGNMLDRLMGEIKLYELDENICTIQTSNYAFDSSLLDLFLPFMTGGRIVIPNEDEITDYEQLADLMDRENVSDLQANPNFLRGFIDACIRINMTFSGNLKRIWSGGESLSQALVTQIRNNFPGVMISNHYGPTEGTIDAIVNKNIKEFSKNIIGKPIYNMNCYLLDNFLNIQPVNFPGEICISGKGLAEEYLNLPRLTKEKFINHPFRRNERLYKTGDLGRLLPDGNIEYLGRIDDQIKIRGYRIELAEIENVILRHKTVKDAVVLSKSDASGMKYLVAALVFHGPDDTNDLKYFLREELPDFMLPSFYIQLQRLPVTSVGKIDKKMLERICDERINATGSLVKPKNETEEKLHLIWKNIFHRDNISTESNFFEIGGQSLKATQLIFQIFRDFKVKLNFKDIFQYPTIIMLSGHITNARQSAFVSIPIASKKEYYTASSAQKRIWIISQDNEMSKAYNLADGYVLEGEVHEQAFQNAFFSMIERHESLRTTFLMSNGDLKQKIDDDTNIITSAFQYADISSLGEEEIDNTIDTAVHHILNVMFDLERGPLIKMRLFKLEEKRYLLLYTMHHIISDEWAFRIFIDEFLIYYRKYAFHIPDELPALTVQYKDFSEWKSEMSQGLIKQEKFWLQKFSGQLSKINLPFDRQRSWEFGLERKVQSDFHPAFVPKLKEFALQEEVTLFMVLFASLSVFLYKITGQEDITIGIISAGRNNPELEEMIGLFVNTLALRNYPRGSKIFKPYLKEIKNSVLDAFQNQDYEFEELIKKLKIEREVNRHPLFDVLFEFQTDIEVKPEGFSIRQFEFEHHAAAKFDLTITVTEGKNNISVSWVYNASLFNESTITKFAELFTRVTETLIGNPYTQLKQLDFTENSIVSDRKHKENVLSESENEENKMFRF